MSTTGKVDSVSHGAGRSEDGVNASGDRGSAFGRGSSFGDRTGLGTAVKPELGSGIRTGAEVGISAGFGAGGVSTEAASQARD